MALVCVRLRANTASETKIYVIAPNSVRNYFRQFRFPKFPRLTLIKQSARSHLYVRILIIVVPKQRFP